MKVPSVQEQDDGLLAQNVRMIWDLFHAIGAHAVAVAARHGLTPPQSRALMSLGQPAPMRHLAEQLSCDKSHVTGIVDGLEELGLVIRQVDSHDRRIKQLTLTASGRRMYDQLQAETRSGVPGLENLTVQQQQELHDLLCAALYPDGVVPTGCGAPAGTDVGISLAEAG